MRHIKKNFIAHQKVIGGRLFRKEREKEGKRKRKKEKEGKKKIKKRERQRIYVPIHNPFWPPHPRRPNSSKMDAWGAIGH